MKRIAEYRKLFGSTKETTLAELKVLYRSLIKEWHPDKFLETDPKKQEAEQLSKTIIDGYHFLVSISPETHEEQKAEYQQTITVSGIDTFVFKGQVLKVTFIDGSVYEYFGVPHSVYNKFLNSPLQFRFARRHIFENYIFRKSLKVSEE